MNLYQFYYARYLEGTIPMVKLNEFFISVFVKFFFTFKPAIAAGSIYCGVSFSDARFQHV